MWANFGFGHTEENYNGEFHLLYSVSLTSKAARQCEIAKTLQIDRY